MNFHQSTGYLSRFFELMQEKKCNFTVGKREWKNKFD